MTTCPLVMIEWEDSAQPSPSWAFLANTKPSRAVRCVSVGWLIENGKKVKALAPNMGDLGESDVQVSGVIRIPARSVVKVTRLKEPKITS